MIVIKSIFIISHNRQLNSTDHNPYGRSCSIPLSTTLAWRVCREMFFSIERPNAVLIACVTDCRVFVTEKATSWLSPIRCKDIGAIQRTVRSYHTWTSLLVIDMGSCICRDVSLTMALLSAVRTERLFFLEPFWSSGIKSNSPVCRITSFSIFYYSC